MNSERDKFLTEAMGECWHEYNEEISDKCCKCEEDILPYVKAWLATPENKAEPVIERLFNFSTWEGFGKLWEWAMKQEWWIRNFIIEPWKSNHIAVDMRLINPDIFADALEKFLKEKDR